MRLDQRNEKNVLEDVLEISNDIGLIELLSSFIVMVTGIVDHGTKAALYR
jgi:putative effector of murein hydrolase